MEYYNKTPKYFINLNSKTDRLKVVEKEVGVQEDNCTTFPKFIRFEATCKPEWSFQELEEHFDIDRFIKAYNLHFNTSTYFTTLSHYGIYKKVANSDYLQDDDWVLICEDDNSYVVDFPKKLDQLLAELSNKRYEHIELVKLKMFEFERACDYFPYLLLYTKQKLNKKGKQLKKQQEQHPLYHSFNLLCTSAPEKHLNTRKEWSTELNYKDVQESDYPFYSNNHKLFQTSYLQGYSAACYLIRKSTCKRIVNSYKKAWWIADDFGKIVPLTNMLFISPFMAEESEVAKSSSINIGNTIRIIYNLGKLQSFYNKYRMFTLDLLPFILKYNISPSKTKRLFSRFMQRVLFLHK